MQITIPELDPMVWVAAGAALVVLVGLVMWLTVRRRRRTAALQERFGSEYDRTVEGTGRRRAEADLEDRLELYEELELRPLSQEARLRYGERWRTIQLGFVDEPTEAVREAERLTREAMGERGYPVDDFEARVAAVSVEFPHLAERYRHAHGLSLDPEERPFPTEELRQVLLDYRLLLEELMEEGPEEEQEPVA